MSAASLRVMSWNILSGGEDRFARVLALLAQVRPDVLVLEECVGWEDGERLRQVSRALDVAAEPAHVFLGVARPRPSGRRYHVALVSRPPITRRLVHDDARTLGHCIAEVDLEVAGEPVTVLGTHFDSYAEDLRLTEARYLRALVTAGRLHERRAILAGDLNALSRRDAYPETLAALLQASGIDKYGIPPRFDTIDEIEAQGWVDALHAKALTPAWITAQRERAGVSIGFRTDYIFASPPMARALTGAEIVAVDGASDHEAIVATFEWAGAT